MRIVNLNYESTSPNFSSNSHNSSLSPALLLFLLYIYKPVKTEVKGGEEPEGLLQLCPITTKPAQLLTPSTQQLQRTSSTHTQHAFPPPHSTLLAPNSFLFVSKQSGKDNPRSLRRSQEQRRKKAVSLAREKEKE